MRKIKTIEDLKTLTLDETKEYLENYILIFITEEILLSCMKKEGSYIFRELNMGYTEKPKKRCTGYNCQYSITFATPEQAMDELIHRSSFLRSFLQLNKPQEKLLCHVSKLCTTNIAQKS